MFKKDELKLLWPFYLVAVLTYSVAVINPIVIVFFSRKFSLFQVSLAMALNSAAGILFEMPSGALADLIGRKPSLVLAFILSGMLIIIMPFINTPPLFYMAFFASGVVYTLQSEADEAWMMDWLLHNKKETLMHDMFMKLDSLRSIGFVIGSLLSTLILFFLEMRHLFYVHGIGFILIGIFLLFIREDFRKYERANIQNIMKTAHMSKQGVSFIFEHKSLLYLVLATTIACFPRTFHIAWQPLLVDLSLPAKYLGIVYSVEGLIGIVAPLFVKRLLAKFENEKNYFIAISLLEFLVLLSLILVDKPFFIYGIAIYLFVRFITSLEIPAFSALFHSLVPSGIRATVGSAKAMALSVVSFVSMVVGGYLIDKFGPKVTIVLYSFFLIPAIFFYSRIKTKEGNDLAYRETRM